MSLHRLLKIGSRALVLVGLSLANQSAFAQQQGWPFLENQGRPNYSSGSTRVFTPSYLRPASVISVTPAVPIATETVQIEVNVPADAKVYFNGTPTTQTGMSRNYTTSGLTPGVQYRYNVRAEWKDSGRVIERTRTISFMAGAQIQLDFVPATLAAGR